ncbi:receptor-like protein 12 [Gossypium australe]|uniref:Receptor-like protein 12 n=1 Tax=Gossypium australe TaxID=47621 RepID=A0A5B6WE26_9ROSI|nr:receptor-like protein 12 [Gossypium australe]
MNGAVEAANKKIKKIMGKLIETYKYWHEKLPIALYAYRTSVRTSTGETPFSLVYGMEAILRIEVEIFSLRVLSELKGPGIEKDLSHTKGLQRKVDVKLGRTLMKQIEDSKSYLSEVPIEQIEAINIISLKLQWSRLKIANLISLKLQWNRLKLQVTNLISLKLQ